MKMIKSLTEYEQTLLNHEFSVMIYFSDWCSDCHFMDTFLPTLETTYPKISFFKVNREALKSLSIHLNVYGVPSLLFYHHDTLIKSYIDKSRKSFIEVSNFIEQCLNEMERR